MKKIILIISFLTPFLSFSQKKYYQSSDNKHFNEKEYEVKKQEELKSVQARFGDEYDIESDGW